jgi:hypothetical protein
VLGIGCKANDPSPPELDGLFQGDGRITLRVITRKLVVGWGGRSNWFRTLSIGKVLRISNVKRSGTATIELVGW